MIIERLRPNIKRILKIIFACAKFQAILYDIGQYGQYKSQAE